MFERLERLDMSYVVTIDGPAASGKTSVSRELSKLLGCRWVSTGVFYRGIAFIVYKEKIDVKNEDAIAKLVNDADWEVRMDADETYFFYNGKDVTKDVHKEEVGTVASKISQFQKLRKNLLEAQRDCENSKGLVAEGRDCGTVVFPHAPVKIYLTARSEDRAQRRAQESGAKADKILEMQKKRDARDSQRTVAPMQVPEGAHVIDTSELSLNEVVNKVHSICQQIL